MKKTILAAVIFGLIGANAIAQSNVTVYGVVDMGFEHEDDGSAAGGDWKLESGGQSSSRLGFKGVEDLGGGLKANFVLESGIAADTGMLGNGGRLFGRRATLGLSGAFGSVDMGRQYNSLYKVVSSFDPFSSGLAGAVTRMFNTYGSRMDSTITYALPKMNGFFGEASYAFGEVPGNSSASAQYGFNGGYSSGPLRVALGHHQQNNATATDEAKTTALGASYDFGVVKTYLMVAVNKGVGTLDTRDMLIGVTAPVGRGLIMADYIRKTDQVNANADANQIAVGYSYSLSKRTNLYTSYARISNDAAASYRVSAAGQSNNLFNVGVRHKF